MGTHGHGGIKHAFLGSVTERTLRSTERPVLAVKENSAQASRPIQRILLAVDFSKHSDRALEIAAFLARRMRASVDVIHAFDLPSDYLPYASSFGMDLERKIQAAATERLDAIREQLEKSDIPVSLQCRRGHPSSVIAAVAEETRCQLIAMGTRGARGLSHVLLGSVAERTIRTAPCSVLAVPAEA